MYWKAPRYIVQTATFKTFVAFKIVKFEFWETDAKLELCLWIIFSWYLMRVFTEYLLGGLQSICTRFSTKLSNNFKNS